MAQYYSGQVNVPAGGAAVPVCSAGTGGCLISNAGNKGVYVGGPDVTPDTGLLLESGSMTLIPGGISVPPPVIGAEPPAPLLLYACSVTAQKLTWMSGQPPVG